MMFYDYNKRNYLLPPGCKDLIDLLKLEEMKPPFPLLDVGQSPLPQAGQFVTAWKLPGKHKKAKPSAAQSTPAPTGSFREVEIPETIAVSALAEIVGQKPFHIIADFMAFGVFATLHSEVQFEAAAKVLRKYGLIAKKAGS